MRYLGLGLLIGAAACLSGCGSTAATGPVAQHGGRYLGIGIYQPGPLWARMVAAARPADSPAATVADDEQVIVVVDSNTGEVRQCGNFSGHCIAMNPWAGAVGRGQSAPVALNAHAADLERAASENAEVNAAAASAAAPARRR